MIKLTPLGKTIASLLQGKHEKTAHEASDHNELKCHQ